jgi:deoxyribose-phosphate aldolase
MVIDRGALGRDWWTVFQQIVAVKEACRRADGTHAHLKVILEPVNCT